MVWTLGAPGVIGMMGEVVGGGAPRVPTGGTTEFEGAAPL
jgi:hypothetical protein